MKYRGWAVFRHLDWKLSVEKKDDLDSTRAIILRTHSMATPEHPNIHSNPDRYKRRACLFVEKQFHPFILPSHHFISQTIDDSVIPKPFTLSLYLQPRGYTNVRTMPSKKSSARCKASFQLGKLANKEEAIYGNPWFSLTHFDTTMYSDLSLSLSSP